jgi:hypothetical protein
MPMAEVCGQHAPLTPGLVHGENPMDDAVEVHCFRPEPPERHCGLGNTSCRTSYCASLTSVG